MAIEAICNELSKIETKKKKLVKEVASLCVAQKDLDELKGKVESLSKALEGLKAAEQLALERAQKANDSAKGLRKEADAE